MDRSPPDSPRIGLDRTKIAGALIFFAVLITLITTSDSRTDETLVTDIGERNSITLSDGSVVTLNTNTSVRIAHESQVLHFELLRGEVLFAMSENPYRHLLVSAADVSIGEAGTTFAVRRVDSGDVLVTVESGTVFLVSAHVPRTLLVKNDQVSVPEGDRSEGLHTTHLTPLEVKDQLAWRNGELVFRHATLAEAAHEFGRYNRHVKIEVLGAAAAVQVGGAFSAGDPLAFAQSVTFLNPEVRLQIDAQNPERRILRLTQATPD
jgi:transmembrane sensor